MRAQWAAVLVVICAAGVARVGADVTVRQQAGGKALGQSLSGEMVQYIKGTKMRTDQSLGGKATSTIMDVGAQQLIVLDHAKKEANVTDMAKIAGELAKISADDIKAAVAPTAQTRKIAGSSCTVHDMRIMVPMQMGNETIQVVMSGPVCLAKGGPGAADYATFYRAASEKGMFFGDPRQARAQPGQAKGMTRMYLEMADRGVPLASDIQIKFEGGGMLAGMMSKMGGSNTTTEVLSIATDAIPDATFEIPAGYKVKKS